ncbi:MAG: hypothetical protein A2X49_04295 [Lentisphaerae bacterium GWF2_52_8]|nr:MAG: hypothetical protein A2X49_04295 [Lentisphaerae bacterium GWF2_52_8]
MALGGMLPAFSGNGAELGAWTFADGPQGWTATGQASVSEIIRRPDTKSLKISQSKDSEQDSAWLSPLIKSEGKPVRVCFWAADNYTKQPDYSYSAAIGFSIDGADGKPGVVQTWEQIPWDDARLEQWWGSLTPAGLVWKYHEAVFTPGAKDFRVKFFWPKAIVRGECLISDIRVLDAASSKSVNDEKSSAASGEKKDDSSGYALEISTAANGNLFQAEDPLRFEFLLFDPSGKALAKLSNPEISYDISDYEKFHIASGKIAFDKAVPCAIDKNDKKRINNLRLSHLIADASAKETGREFFLHAILKDGDKVIAEDTISYGVVNPRPIDPKNLSKCLFVNFTGESLRTKMGISYIHDWDYSGWKQAQPQYPGPIKISPKPAFPKLIYCPNLEQIRSRKPDHPWGHVGSMAPEAALLDDPFHPGCKAFNIDAYVEYIVARVKAQRESIAMVVPSGLERGIDARTIELQRKAYAALKKEFPDLPVGIMLYGLFMNPSSQAKIFMDEKLYECADFIDDHMYQPSMDWTEWDRIRKEVKAKGKDLYFISTEFSRVGGNDQVERSRDMISSHIEAWSHGMKMITYFNVPANLKEPVLRGGVGDGFQWIQVVPRPQVSDAIQADKRSKNSTMPLLQCMTYYNLVQNFEGAEFKASFKPGKNSVAYVFARDGKTVCAIYQTKPALPEILAVNSDVPFTAQDMFGRTERLEAKQTALITATGYPSIITFEKELPKLYDAGSAGALIKELESDMRAPLLPRGAKAKLKLTIPPAFSSAFSAELSGTVDGTWPKAEPQTIKFAAGQPSQVELPISIAAETEPGTYTFTIRISEGKRLLGVLKMPLTVSDLISLQMSGVPKTPMEKPAIAVSLRNLSDSEKSGELSIENSYFGTSAEPEAMAQKYSIPAEGEASLRFELPPEEVNLATSYLITAKLKDKSGISLSKQEEVSFRASQKTASPITIDGDLSDWKLDELCPVPFERYHSSWGKLPESLKDLDAVMYSRWDSENLYFAVIVSDDNSVRRANDLELWHEDNIMLGLYPWGWKLGEPLNSGYYREHLGLCADGQARLFRVGNPPGGQSDSKGISIAVKRNDAGYVYEWAYPLKSISPLELKPGSRFRLSVAACDIDQKPDGKFTPLGAIQLGGFNLSIDAQPSKWREFILIEK